MAGNFGANRYRQTSIKTANRGQLLIMLYEAAILSVKKAAESIDRKDIAGKGAKQLTFNQIALELRLDPADVRRINMIPKDKFPYTLANGKSMDVEILKVEPYAH